LSGHLFDAHPQISSARVFLDHKSVSLPLDLAARSIPRYELDAALLESARQAGVRTKEGTRVREVDQSKVTSGGVFKVKTAEETLSSRAVVNTTGRWSQLTRHSAFAADAKWIGVKAHFREPNPPDSVDLYFFPGGYCGVQKVGKDAVNAAAMLQVTVGRSLEDVFAAHPELSLRSRDWEPIFPAITTSPLFFRKAETREGHMLLAGDAAGFIDPFAGDGISLALHSGSLAAEALAGFFKNQCSLAQAEVEYRVAYRKRFAPAFRNAARLRMFLRTPSWIRSRLLGLVSTGPIAGLIVHGTRARTS
jgi:flavin-dependent dehydrogenase